ncbi:thiamine ABC transporter ATP-binding protein ThiQ [Candidatus Williamhamiltonella defendens]|uniref:thiamine ABC transporter ATP-binding protein ThiQ n=1 Tax=Candidatus Williamhamiltonella defendens TaxID=138072 RepID=UPI001582C293|nr:thiamine ABC transporter ATP-binding protein ThiQ [Candidatus Hamiltonella defensa]
MLILEDVIYLYDGLHMNFNFQIKQNERVAILGPSGAGKSTLLSLISGFLTADKGLIFLNNQNHTSTTIDKRPISILFQENNLFSHLTIEQNIGLGLNPSLKLTPSQKISQVEIAKKMGIENYLQRLPAQLSGGQRQRAALVRCFLRSQPILLLDEPFSSLDPALRHEILQLLDEICTERQITLLMVSHNLADAARIAKRTLLIVEGKIYYDGSTHDLLTGNTPEASVLGIHPIF